MAVSTQSEFVDFIVPLRERMRLYDLNSPPKDQPRNDAADPTKAIPQGFIDAMIVREEVFVQEQDIPLANELDDDDPVSDPECDCDEGNSDPDSDDDAEGLLTGAVRE